ncbi:hypothetical protein BX589_101121 [Paraburkholderia fungorum]|jgi:hypothetical protein|uniref:hypothetical protein n=1 Tax=Paraburkholderia fungorum TaxID=134537 RepID=UPI000D048FC0|nr:hypothetical protein [Paraburkholderia fungorum]PRZ56471.1 hypothetical protein BX589_101121 [Paraburkholderia fungorum]
MPATDDFEKSFSRDASASSAEIERPVVSVQVAPCYLDGDVVVSQFNEGPDVRTEFWTIYERHDDHTVEAVKDITRGTPEQMQERAERLGAVLAKWRAVPLEEHVWIREAARRAQRPDSHAAHASPADANRAPLARREGPSR